MRNLFLADSLGQSLKAALVIYLTTYLGAWFNLLTLAMVMWVTIFTMPKLYTMNRPMIDRGIAIISGNVRRLRTLDAGKDAVGAPTIGGDQGGGWRTSGRRVFYESGKKTAIKTRKIYRPSFCTIGVTFFTVNNFCKYTTLPIVYRPVWSIYFLIPRSSNTFL